MRQILHSLYKKLVIHWQTTIMSLIIFVGLFMYYRKDIDTEQFIILLGSLVGVKALFSKDPNKVQTKREFQVPDVPKKHDPE